MHHTMMDFPLTLPHLLERARRIFGQVELVSQLPDHFQVVDEIPRTSTGKFKKTALRERFAGGE